MDAGVCPLPAFSPDSVGDGEIPRDPPGHQLIARLHCTEPRVLCTPCACPENAQRHPFRLPKACPLEFSPTCIGSKIPIDGILAP